MPAHIHSGCKYQFIYQPHNFTNRCHVVCRKLEGWMRKEEENKRVDKRQRRNAYEKLLPMLGHILLLLENVLSDRFGVDVNGNCEKWHLIIVSTRHWEQSWQPAHRSDAEKGHEKWGEKESLGRKKWKNNEMSLIILDTCVISFFYYLFW